MALDPLTCISASSDDKDEIEVIEMKLHRLIRSALDVMASALIDRVDDWAEKGRRAIFRRSRL